MDVSLTVLVSVLAGLGAGIGVGCGGMSSAVVVTPVLVTFLHLDAFRAIGVALCADVLASLASAVVYGKNGNLHPRKALLLMASVIVFTIVGTLISRVVTDRSMGGLSVVITLLTGLKLLVRPVTDGRPRPGLTEKRRVVESIMCGAGVGLVCGFVGAGGGMMMLLVLVTFLGYAMKEAVGTSVFIMTFTAAVGAIAHFTEFGVPSLWVLIPCVLATLVSAHGTSTLANRAKPKTLSRATGALAVTLAVAIFIFDAVK